MQMRPLFELLKPISLGKVLGNMKEKTNNIWKDEKGPSSHQSDTHWNCFKGNVGETVKWWGGAHNSGLPDPPHDPHPTTPCPTTTPFFPLFSSSSLPNTASMHVHLHGVSLPNTACMHVHLHGVSLPNTASMHGHLHGVWLQCVSGHCDLQNVCSPEHHIKERWTVLYPFFLHRLVPLLCQAQQACTSTCNVSNQACLHNIQLCCLK